MGEIKPFQSSCTFIFDYIFYCAFFIILILVVIDKKENQFGNNLEWFHCFDMKIHKKLLKITKSIKSFTKNRAIYKHIADFQFRKTVLLENRVSGGVPVHRYVTTLLLQWKQKCKFHCFCISWLSLRPF